LWYRTMTTLLIAIAAAQPSIPYFAPGTIPTLIPGSQPSATSQPTIIPQASGGIPGTITFPSLTPIFSPALTPAYVPGSLSTLNGVGGLITGQCIPTGQCVPQSPQAFAAIGLAGNLTCLSGPSCAAGTTLPVTLIYPNSAASRQTQAQCNAAFFVIICNNALGLTSTQLATYFSGGCLCLSTGVAGCPSCNTSKKGLLGLLGLLGIIPLILLLLLLLLCCCRRRKRQQDVHFATFDPAAANLGVPAPSLCGAPPPCPGPF